MRLEFRWKAGTPAHGTRTDRAVLGVFSHIGPTLTLVEALVCVADPYRPDVQQHVRIGQVSHPLGSRLFTPSELEEEVRRLLLDLLRRGEEACMQPATDPAFTPLICANETAWLREHLGAEAVVEQTGPSRYQVYVKGRTVGRVEGRFTARDACTRFISLLNLLFVSSPEDIGPLLGSSKVLSPGLIHGILNQSRALE